MLVHEKAVVDKSGVSRYAKQAKQEGLIGLSP